MTAYDLAAAATRVGHARQWLAESTPGAITETPWRHIGRGGSIIEDLLAERAKLADRLELIIEDCIDPRTIGQLRALTAELREGS